MRRKSKCFVLCNKNGGSLGFSIHTASENPFHIFTKRFFRRVLDDERLCENPNCDGGQICRQFKLLNPHPRQENPGEKSLANALKRQKRMMERLHLD